MIELRDFVAGDGDLIREWIRSPEELLLWAGPTFQWPLDEDQLAAYETESAGPSRQTWTATNPSTGDPVGHASINLADPDVARMGRILIDPDRRGHGLGNALVRAVLSHALSEMSIARIDLGVFAHNTPAVRLYQRHGFECHTLLRDVERIGETSWNAMQMSLTRDRYNGLHRSPAPDIRRRVAP